MRNEQWIPPHRGWYKINVDAATNGEAQIVGSGAVIRDADGKVIADAATKGEAQIVGLGAVIRDADGKVIAAAVKEIIKHTSYLRIKNSSNFPIIFFKF